MAIAGNSMKLNDLWSGKDVDGCCDSPLALEVPLPPSLLLPTITISPLALIVRRGAVIFSIYILL